MSIMLLMDDMGLDLSSIEIYSTTKRKSQKKWSLILELRFPRWFSGRLNLSFFADRLFKWKHFLKMAAAFERHEDDRVKDHSEHGVLFGLVHPA